MAVPVDLTAARAQLRMGNDSSRDVEIEGFISDAVAWVESYTGHILEAREVEETFDGFSRLRLRAWPIKPGAEVVVSYGEGGMVATTITGSRLSMDRRPARILPPPALAWPHLRTPHLVIVTLRAGYEDEDVVPGNIRRAMLVLISAYDTDREGGDVFRKAEETARNLCRDLRPRAL